MALPRIWEVAAELGIDFETAMKALRDLGEFAKGPSSSIQPPVARRLRQYIQTQDPDLLSPLVFRLGQSEAAAILYAALPKSMPRLLQTLISSSRPPLARALTEAMSERRMYLLDSAEEATSTQVPLVDALPAPSGVAIVRMGENPNAATLITWASKGHVMQTATLLLRATSGKLIAPSSGSAVRNYALDESGPNTPAWRSFLAAAAKPDLEEREELAGDVTPPRVSARSASSKTEHPDDPNEVRIIHLTSRPVGKTGSRAGHSTSRWHVRGHWRRQWYPSTAEHKKIWITDHDAGSVEAPLSRRDIVWILGSD
jgi:hypothetical protein